jgi:hypothetical protein
MRVANPTDGGSNSDTSMPSRRSFRRFAFELRDIIRRQPLPDNRLLIERDGHGRELLAFVHVKLSMDARGQHVERHVLRNV